MTTVTIILSLTGVALCIVGIIRDHPPLHSFGIFIAAISLVLAIITTM
jgi:hypothetical protein